MVIGADYHPGFQQIAFVDTDTGELQERRLQHRKEARGDLTSTTATDCKDPGQSSQPVARPSTSQTVAS
jgi:hypothetical protein